MSDDFDFDANDLFDDFDDDDDFSDFDNEFADDNVIDDNEFDDFDNGFEDDGFDDFDDDEFGARLDFLDDGDFDDGDDVVAIAEDDGGNRTFLYAAIAMVIVFVLGLLLILFLVLGGFTNSAEAEATQLAFEATSTAVFIENETRQAQLAASATAAVENVTATRQAALDATETAIADENATNEAEISGSATALVVNATATQEAAVEATDNAIGTATQMVIDEEQAFIDSATETAIAVEQTLNPPEPSVTVDPDLLVTVDPNVNLPTPIPVTRDADGLEVVMVPIDPTSMTPIPPTENPLPNAPTVNPLIPTQFVTPNPVVPTIDPSAPTPIPVTRDASGLEVVIIVVDPISLTPIPPTENPLPNAPTVNPLIPTLIVTPIPQDIVGIPTTGPAVSLPAVQQTATALAELFLATPTPNEVLPTAITTSVVDATNVPDVAVQPDGTDSEALPDTGLFDDVFGSNPTLIILTALGLLGVIIFSRTVRNTNNKEL